MTEMNFEKGEIIFREGDLGDRMYILKSGNVELKKKVEKGEVVLKTISKPSEFFGEMALIDHRPRSASAIATVDTALLSIDGHSFEKMIVSNGNFALKIIKILSERIRNSNQHLEELIETSPRKRIMAGMAGYALKYGQHLDSGPFRVSLRELRQWINSHLGIAFEELDACIEWMLHSRIVAYAGTSRDHLIISNRFVQEYANK
ncbi:MAG: Crp/Fnr family transcriptional regulator [Spirochaetaceae bacterium]|jgi:CRP-like cAMP-binding protein|nr:Crp/Fnr family transcriptional regulator [Spirochaetaceae bacterium]